MRVILYGICIVVLSALCVPVSAEGGQAGIKITHIQAGASGDARQELIVLANTSLDSIDVSNWCLKNKSSIAFYCFVDPDNALAHYSIPAGSYATIVSRQYADRYTVTSDKAAIYDAQNQSSGAILAGSDTMSLVDLGGTTIDQKSWTSGWTSGQVLQRQFSGAMATDVWTAGVLSQLPAHNLLMILFPPPTCEQKCTSTYPPLEITEILANPEGVDTGQEFVELFNESDEAVNLDGYSLTVHSSTDKSLPIENGVTVPARSYVVLKGESLNVTLPNTRASVSIVAKDGTVVSESLTYDQPLDGQSWSLFNDGWAYTEQVTPGEENKPMSIKDAVEREILLTSLVKPCAIGQYRHPETNRCRLIVTQSNSVPTPCQEGYYRHPDTGRCRKIATVSAPVTCKEGQERNPETGRCRKVHVMTRANDAVLQAAIEEKPQQWYIVGVIILAVVGLLLYGICEWRHDIKRLFEKFPKFSIGHK